jgi:wobble nucleotide-excising tRNase
VFLKKITKLQNIGKFHKGGVSGGEYGKYTLFYAGNGRGKTTLCAVLRSMKTGNATIIEDRRTLGETATPEAQLLLDSGTASFTNGKWKNGESDLHIFDGAFITENVHAGEQVSTDHRRNIYRIIVGAKGLQLAEEVDQLDAQVTDHTTKIGTEKKALQQHVPAGMTFDNFLALAEDPDIDVKIAEQQEKIKAASESTDIATTPLLKPQPIPSLPSGFVVSLEKTVEGISADAAQKVQEHLSKHQFGKDGEAWVASGLQHVHDDRCPFCANDVKDNTLVEMYRQYFDQAYKAFKAELVVLRNTVLQDLSEAEGLKTKSRFEGLSKEVEYWRAFGKVDFVPVASLDTMPGELTALYVAAKQAIEAKIAAPLETLNLDKVQQTISAWQTAADEMKACIDSVVQANADIQAIKTSTASVNKVALEAMLKELEAIKKRYFPAVTVLADSYNRLAADKDVRVADKEKKKDDLDAYDKAVLPKYQNAINVYLTQFGAGFSLMKSEKNYVGIVPQWMYTIEINKCPVEVTKAAGHGEPSFQTTMSAGDRSTLALAFFLAQLDLDANLKDAVVVFDDPFISLDEFRKAMTARTIFRVGLSASQIIVLSHDKYFLEAVADAVIGAKCEAFQISATKMNSAIEAWDLEREVRDGYLRAHMDMLDFHNGNSGSASEMRLKMRPLLEDYIRYRFPNQIPEGKWLGDMLGIIAADPNHPLQSVYQDIDDIKSFTAPHHHNTNTPFNEQEVLTYVGRTLTVVGGC